MLAIEIGKKIPFNVEKYDGSQLEILMSHLSMVIQFPGLTRAEMRGFSKGFKHYYFHESSTFWYYVDQNMPVWC